MWRDRPTATSVEDPVVAERTDDSMVVERTDDPVVVERSTQPTADTRAIEHERRVNYMPSGSMVARVLLTLIGAAALIAGAMLDWVNGIVGTSISWKAYYRTEWGGGSPFITSAGAIVIGIAILGLIGLASRGGWPIRLAGALGMVAFVLLLIQAIRANVVNNMGDVQAGMWLVLAGGLVMLIGGSFGGWKTLAAERGREAAVRS